MASGYDEIYGAWKNNPKGFWAKAAEDIHWTKTWYKVLDDSRRPFYKWFSCKPVIFLRECLLLLVPASFQSS